MKETDFINKNSANWENLRTISLKIDTHGINKLSSAEVKEFLHLFRSCSRNLAYARTHFPESHTYEYLNSLIGKSHNLTYGVKKFNPSSIINYFKRDFPSCLKDGRIFILVSFMIFLSGFILSLILTLVNKDNAAYFLPEALVKGFKGTQGNQANSWNYPLMSSQIMVNNITVALKAFAYGITLSIGTIYILFSNGLIVGSLTALMYLGGDPFVYWSLILPHGVIELTAIFIAGAAGLMIGYSILIPGQYSRKYSLIAGAKKAVFLIFGVVAMLVVAAVIEGFFTPLSISPGLKLLFALTTAILLTVYFILPYTNKTKYH